MKSECTDDFHINIIKKYSDMVYKLAYSLVKTRFDADDIYQEVFMRYIRKDPKFHSPEHERAWFLRVTINCCKNQWKSPWAQRMVELDEDSSPAAAEPCEGQSLIETVKELPEKYRAVIHLFYYEGLSVEEIGRVTRSKASTVRTRLTRARRLLKERLEEEK